MVYGEVALDIPGLTKIPEVRDMEISNNIYNNLKDLSNQPKILQSHIENLATLFVRYNAFETFGIHLVHSHFIAPPKNIILGTNDEEPYSRWTRLTPINDLDPKSIHGHVFLLTDHGFHPYEYQYGPMPDSSGVSSGFITELADYLKSNNLTTVVGLQILDQNIDPNILHMLELVLVQGTIMMDGSALEGCTATLQTGWRFGVEDGKPRVCTTTESHGQNGDKHEVFNKGTSLPSLNTIKDVKCALVNRGILPKKWIS